MNPGQGLPKRKAYRLLLVGLALVLLIPACSPQANKNNEELRQEIKGLKSEIKALKEEVAKLEAGQQAMLALLKKSASPPPVAALPPQPSPMLAQPQVTTSPAGAKPLTVSQLLAGQDRYIGTRVTVLGQAGPVLVHHKSLILMSPQGMVEVFFGKIADQKQVQYLTSATLQQPVTVTGVVGLPTKPGSARLQIEAESIEF
jgi:cell division septum initiation protein DivIVA